MIYAITCSHAGSQFVKFGYTTDELTLGRRLTQLQVGNPFQIDVAALFPGDRTVESNIHHKLRDEWTQGEWFSGPKTDELAARMRRVYERREFGDARFRTLKELDEMWEKFFEHARPID